jgi:hypothetical protein
MLEEENKNDQFIYKTPEKTKIQNLSGIMMYFID